MTATECPFCNLPEKRIWVQTDSAIAFLDNFPVSLGHTLVIPGDHIGALMELPENDLKEIWELVAHVRKLLIEKYNPATINNAVARQRVQKALDNKALIDKFVAQQGGALKVSLQDASLDINKMIELIYQLARKIDSFESYAQGNQTTNAVAIPLFDR